MRHTGDRMIGRSRTLLDEMTSGSVQASEVVQRAIMKLAEVNVQEFHSCMFVILQGESVREGGRVCAVREAA